MNRFHKILKLHKWAAVFIWADLSLTIALSILLLHQVANIYLQILLFVLVTCVGSCLLAAAGNGVFCILLKRLAAQDKTVLASAKLSEPSLDCLQLTAKTKTYCWLGRHLNTISVSDIDTCNAYQCKQMLKDARQNIRENLALAKETDSRKRHWKFDINILRFAKSTNVADACQLIAQTNSNVQLFEIGKITLGWMEDTQTLIIKTFDSKRINFLACFRYWKAIKLVCKHFHLHQKEILNLL